MPARKFRRDSVGIGSERPVLGLLRGLCSGSLGVLRRSSGLLLGSLRCGLCGIGCRGDSST